MFNELAGKYFSGVKMRAIPVLLLLLLLLLSACGCLKEENAVSEDDYYVELGFENRYHFSENVVLRTEDTFSLAALPDYFNATIDNSSDGAYMYRDFFILEKKIDDAWYTFPPQPANDIGYYLGPYSCAEVRFGIAYYHEKLSTGLYRIISLISQAGYEFDYSGTVYMIVCEFSVEI